MKISPWLSLAGLLALAFTLATWLATSVDNWSPRAKPDNIFGMLLGDGRKLFANQFFTMADVYFHSGYYPSIFDNQAGAPKAIVTASQGQVEHEDHEGHAECEKNGSFLGQPKDWIDTFGRNFRITLHTHLEARQEREILPWLRLAADLDPQKIETFTVGAYFMREHLDRPAEAEAFLREGLRSNPDNCEILFELGRIYRENQRDLVRARNVWQLGVKKFLLLPPDRQKEDKMVYGELTMHLARLEQEAGNLGAAMDWLRAVQQVSPAPDAIQKQINALQEKMTSALPKRD